MKLNNETLQEIRGEAEFNGVDTFVLVCSKCGSTNTKDIYDCAPDKEGKTGDLLTGIAYTGIFFGSHYIKCKDCNNFKKIDFEVKHHKGTADDWLRLRSNQNLRK